MLPLFYIYRPSIPLFQHCNKQKPRGVEYWQNFTSAALKKAIKLIVHFKEPLNFCNSFHFYVWYIVLLKNLNKSGWRKRLNRNPVYEVWLLQNGFFFFALCSVGIHLYIKKIPKKHFMFLVFKYTGGGSFLFLLLF